MSNQNNRDKQEILNQARALTNNPDLFYSQLVLLLSESLSLEQFKTACDTVLASTSHARSFHEA